MSFWTPILWISLISPLFIIAKITSQKTHLKYLFGFIIYFLADCYLQSLGAKFLSLDALGLNWNWSGKILSLCLSLSFILFHNKEIRKDIGFTFKFNRRTLKTGVYIFSGFLLFDLVFKLILFPKGGDFNIETFLFQSTMPGLTEELLFRGIYLWLLGKAFTSYKKIKGISFGWNFIIVTVLFAMMHGVSLSENLTFNFDLITIIYLTLITSLSLGLLRKFSGNVILPIFGHNLVNIMNACIRLL